MKPIKVSVCLLALVLVAVVVWAQRPPPATPPGYVLSGPAWEVRALLPQEIGPARHRQVSPFEIDHLAAEGWELVSVTPYVYQNEERGPEGRRSIATQVYPAYYFKRIRPARR